MRKKIAFVDKKTGMWNKKYSEFELEGIKDDASILIVDVESENKNAILPIKELAYEGNKIFNMGENLFMIVMPNVQGEEALQISKDLDDSIKSSVDENVKISIGISERMCNAEWKSVIEDAEFALSEAKQNNKLIAVADRRIALGDERGKGIHKQDSSSASLRDLVAQGYDRCQWVAGEGACAECQAMNGQEFLIQEVLDKGAEWDSAIFAVGPHLGDKSCSLLCSSSADPTLPKVSVGSGETWM